VGLKISQQVFVKNEKLGRKIFYLLIYVSDFALHTKSKVQFYMSSSWTFQSCKAICCDRR